MTWDLLRNGYAEDGRPESRLYWIIGADYPDAYREFDLIYNFCLQLDNVKPGSLHLRDEGRDKCSFETASGQFVETLTGADPTAVGRLEPDGIVGAEVSRWQRELWTRAFGRLARKYQQESWGIFSGSFETSIGPFADYYALGKGPNDQQITSVRIASRENLHKYPGGADDPELLRQKSLLPPHKFLERFEGEPSAPTNAVLTNFSGALHVDDRIDYQPDMPCYISVDPGNLCYAVLFIQPVGGEIWVLDNVYVSGWDHHSVIAETKLRVGWKYAVQTRRGIIDIAGSQHHASASPKELWEEQTGFVFDANKVDVEQTVSRLNSVLQVSPATGRPRLRIHPRADGLIAEGGGGPSPIPGMGIWLRHGAGGIPERKNDHAWKALGYALTSLYGNTMPENMRLPEEMDFDSYAGVSYLERSFN